MTTVAELFGVTEPSTCKTCKELFSQQEAPYRLEVFAAPDAEAAEKILNERYGRWHKRGHRGELR